jgi:hypothetical protein
VSNIVYARPDIRHFPRPSSYHRHKGAHLKIASSVKARPHLNVRKTSRSPKRRCGFEGESNCLALIPPRHSRYGEPSLRGFAGVVQWQNGSFPSCIRGFDSLRPLQSPAHACPAAGTGLRRRRQRQGARLASRGFLRLRMCAGSIRGQSAGTDFDPLRADQEDQNREEPSVDFVEDGIDLAVRGGRKPVPQNLLSFATA